MGEEILGDDKGEDKGDVEVKGEEKKDDGDADKGEEKKEDGDADDKSKDGDADKDKGGAPKTYQDFTVPEGIELDAATLEAATPILKRIGATQEDAQELVNLQAKTVQGIFDTQATEWKKIQDGWKNTAETDPEYGKGKYDESVVVARSAMREVGTPELMAALEETGMGNHPEFVRFFYRVGKAIREDNFNFGNANKENPKSAADRIYPNQGQKKKK